MFYGGSSEVKMKKKKTKNLNEILFARISEIAGASFFKFGTYVDSPNWPALLLQIWFQSDKGS